MDPALVAAHARIVELESQVLELENRLGEADMAFADLESRLFAEQARVAALEVELGRRRPEPPKPLEKAPPPRLRGTSAVLEVVDGEPRGLHLVVPKDRTVTIGRSDEATYDLDGKALSRRHCALKLGESLRLVDLGSQNGTAVNGRSATEPVALAVGDTVELGSVKLVVRSLGAAGRGPT